MADWPRGHDDFEPGNIVALKHGAYSPVLMTEAAKPLAAALAAIEPRLADPAFELELESYVEAHAARRALMADIRQRQEAGENVPQRHFESLATLTNAAHKIANAFGLTPFARARLNAVVTGTRIGQASLVERLAASAGQPIVIDSEIVDEENDDQS